MSWIVVALLMAWFVISVLAQLRIRRWVWIEKLVNQIKGHDYLALIPAWSFFAPNPGTTDFQLMYRDKLLDGQFTVWKAVCFSSNLYGKVIWNPDKRRRKAVVDLCSFLMGDVRRQLASKRPSKLIYISTAYVSLARYVSRNAHSPFSDFTQFMIVVTFGFEEEKKPEIAFISPLYSL